jgi:hypothetical protein
MNIYKVTFTIELHRDGDYDVSDVSADSVRVFAPTLEESLRKAQAYANENYLARLITLKNDDGKEFTSQYKNYRTVSCELVAESDC